MLRWLSIVFVLVLSTPAFGQSGDTEADRLFEEGRQLVREGKYTEACPKFEQAQRLRPGVGTLLNLADCHERRGKTASALEVFREAEALAESSKDDRVSLARTRIEALSPRLVKLTLVVPNIKGLKVTLDDKPYPKELWNSAAPVDPGSHTVNATAPGRPPFSERVDAFSGSVRVELRFTDANKSRTASPASAVTEPQPAADKKELSTQRLIAVGVAGVGVVGLGVSAGFGLASLGAKKDADDHCQLGPSGDGCDATGVDAGDSAIARGNVATVAFIVGSTALAAGAVLWFTDSPNEKRAGAIGLVPFGVRGQF